MSRTVSVIVPVYNVEEYVDKCISSIADQTYKDLEILLVINKSDDRSDLICEQWKKKDPRIQCIYPEERGLGNARNVGIDHATGEYVCFIDSDDWIDSHYVELLLNELIAKNVDIADCNYCKAFSDGTVQYASICSLYKYMPGRLNEAYDSPCAWRNISRLSLWKENDIRYTNTMAEDLSVYSLTRGIAKGVAHIDDVLYFYRVRNDSLTVNVTADTGKFTQLLGVLDHVVSEHKRNDLFEKNKNTLFRQAESHIRFNVYNYSKHNSSTDFEELRSKSDDFLQSRYGIQKNIASRKSRAFGSFNLGRINNYLTLEGKPWEAKYCFSSVISIMSPSAEINIEPSSNLFRNVQIQRDISKSFWEDFTQGNIDIVLWDCMEELSGIVDLGGRFITNSEILKDYYELKKEDLLIEFGSDKWWKLWKTAATAFISRIRSINTSTKIILVRTKLSEYKGERGPRHRFENASEIARMNSILNEMYDYVEKEFPSVKCFGMPDNDLFYSDESFEYGCSPRHLNSALYAYMSMQISDYIEDDR